MYRRFRLVWAFLFALVLVFPLDCSKAATTTPVEHRFSTGWHFFSLAANASADLPSSILKDTNGNTIPLSGNLIGWDSQSQTEVTYDAANPNAFFENKMDHFHGYWLRINDPVTIRFNRYKEISEPFHISLSSGMNMIGYPFERAQTTANLKLKDTITSETKTMQAARDAGWINSILYAWDSEHQGLITVSGLEDDWCEYSDLNPWQGYWLQTFKPNLELIIPVLTS